LSFEKATRNIFNKPEICFYVSHPAAEDRAMHPGRLKVRGAKAEPKNGKARIIYISIYQHIFNI
jgi:hypothetical protein